jgi:hypothetical protein
MSGELTLDTLAVGDLDGMVVITFPEPKRWVKLDPETARRLGEQLAKQAYKARFGDYPTPTKTMLTDALRSRITNRVMLMLRSMQRETPAIDYNVQAERIVDEVLKSA